MKKSLGEGSAGRAGHNLRPRFYETPCIVYKRYKSSCLLLPYSPAVLEPTRIKKQGKPFKRKLILINFERIKKNSMSFETFKLTWTQIYIWKYCRYTINCTRQSPDFLDKSGFFRKETGKGFLPWHYYRSGCFKSLPDQVRHV